jgi:hypothetical protein
MAFSIKSITGVLGAVAPGLAQTITGPLGSVAITALSKVLSSDEKPVEPTEQAVAEALQHPTPEQLLAVKEAENEFQTQMKKLDVDLVKLKNEDIQSARKFFGKDWTPKVFALGIMLGFFGFVFYIVAIDTWNREMEPLLNIILGGLLANLASVVSFYFGNSHGGD